MTAETKIAAALRRIADDIEETGITDAVAFAVHHVARQSDEQIHMKQEGLNE